MAMRKNVIGLLKTLKHPYILPSTEVDFLKGQKVVLLTVRPFSEKRGSLRDIIHKVSNICVFSFIYLVLTEIYKQAKPAKKYSAKYNDPAHPGKGLPLKYIRQFGRQILEVMFL